MIDEVFQRGSKVRAVGVEFTIILQSKKKFLVCSIFVLGLWRRKFYLMGQENFYDKLNQILDGNPPFGQEENFLFLPNKNNNFWIDQSYQSLRASSACQY